MAVGTSGNGQAVWDAMRLREGERLRIVSQSCNWATHATLTDGALVLDREPLVGEVCAVTITRVRISGAVPSCALDEIDRRGKHSNEQTGDAIARHRTLVARQVRLALGKAIKTAAKMGMSRGDLLRGLREIGVSG
jgi:hypothetical protein